ncbi:phosphate acyltransferase [Zhongshania sp. BJYM1]|uniref:phosphate acyltransferase n=1 Tax=Zhongshania aquatica TaxID=2965069 RepID=UPI0022B5B253|nr:phosphate acyltransferase [Marortus sp. BJYM1]
MSGILSALHQQAKQTPKRVILPEHYDPRAITAATILAEKGLATPILISAPGNTELSAGIEVFDQHPDAETWRTKAVIAFTEARAAKGMTEEKAREALQNPVLLAAVLVKLGYADAGVAGSTATTADVLRAGIQGLGLAANTKLVSSFFLMELSDGRVVSYADCAVIPDPSSDELADIAISSAASYLRLTKEQPKVAMLTFSTKGSASHPRVDKVIDALALAKQRAPELNIDGEMQFDAAFVPVITPINSWSDK